MNAVSAQHFVAAEIPRTATSLPAFVYLEEAAEALRLSIRTIDRIIDEGRITAHYLRGRKIVFVEDLQTFMSKLEPVQPKRLVAAE